MNALIGGQERPTGIARKEGPCQFGITVSGDPTSRCRNRVKPGDRFIYGDQDDYKAGGFARQRWCMAHDERSR